MTSFQSYQTNLNAFKTFYNSSCSVCLKSGHDLQRCSKCKTMGYCSKEHQREDWVLHKSLCKVIAKTNEMIALSLYSSYTDFTNYRLSLRMAWESIMNRKLKPWENFAWMFPRVCEVCYDKRNLSDCDKCWCVAYCSEEHKQKHWEKHEKNCLNLKICLDVDRFLLQRVSISSFDIKIKGEYSVLPENVELFLSIKPCPQIDYTRVTDSLINILKREAISPILIAIYSFQASEFIKNRVCKKENITIHIVGSSYNESMINWDLNGYFFLHWSSNVKTIHFVFIGPEVEADIEPLVIENKEYEACLEKERRVIIEYHRKFYHDVVEQLASPDLIILFNSGLHEFEQEQSDTWAPSIPCLFRNVDVPVCLTAYTEDEMERDIKCISKIGVDIQFVVKNMKNPFGGKRPHRNWLTSNSPVFYFDDYITVVKKV